MNFESNNFSYDEFPKDTQNYNLCNTSELGLFLFNNEVKVCFDDNCDTQTNKTRSTIGSICSNPRSVDAKDEIKQMVKPKSGQRNYQFF